MPAVVSLLTAINVGGRQVNKEALCAIHRAAGCQAPETLLASGNVIFETKEKSLPKLAAAIEAEFRKVAGFDSAAILRTRADLEAALAANPFQSEDGSRSLISFLKSRPTSAQVEAALAIDITPERMEIHGQEMFLFFPYGQGVSKLPARQIAKALGSIPSTGRNRNTVEKLLQRLAARG